MSYENEIKHLMRELKFAKSDYLNARLKSEDALRIHSFKTDVETIEFQIEVFKKAAKVDEYEAKVKAWDKYKTHMESHIAGEINEEEFVSDLKSDYFESSEPNAKNDEVDYCTKCTVKPIAKEHMCEECYTEHNVLRDLSTPKQDSDQWYTLYESGVRG